VARSCSPPKSVSVTNYWRTGARKKAKPPETYWECYRKGRGCGRHHRSQGSALKHAKQLDRGVRRQYRRKGEKLTLWHPEKRGAGAR
jgi:hypothetical protein